MTLQMLPLWEIFSDGTQILLCIIIILFLIHNKVKYKQMILKQIPEDSPKIFSNEIIKQEFQQQTEQAFDAIVSCIQRQRISLGNIYTDGEQKKLLAEMPSGSAEFPTMSDEAAEHEDFNFSASNFDQIASMRNDGLSSKEISSRLSIPRGEVELILRLNGISKVSRDHNLLAADG